MREGHTVFSPICHSHPLTAYDLPTDWSFWERHDRDHLERCDEVVVLMLDGWDQSEGVRAELSHAGVLEKPVWYLAAPTTPTDASRVRSRHDARPAQLQRATRRLGASAYGAMPCP